MHIIVNIDKDVFKVQCKSGEQSIKWAAMAASVRLSEKNRQRGRVRWNEFAGEETGRFVPSEVTRADDGKIIEPDMKINEVLKDGDRIVVKLQKSAPPFSSSGFPMPTSWSVQAFSTSQELQKRTTERIKKDMNQEESKRRDLERARVAEAKHIFGDPESDIAREFHEDFTSLARHDSKRAIRLTNSQEELFDFRRTLARYYEEIRFVFDYFSAANFQDEDEDTSEPLITYTEFVHCVHRMNLLNGVKDSSLIESVLKDDCGLRLEATKKSPSGSIMRSEFIEALSRLMSKSSSSSSSSSSKSSDKSSNSNEKRRCITKDVERLLNRFMIPWIDQNVVQNKMNAGISQRDFQDIIRENRSKLERVFRRYCGGGKLEPRSKVSKNKTPHPVGTLSMTGFHDILVAAGCVSDRSSKDQDKKQRRGGKKTTSNKRNKKRSDDGNASSSSSSSSSKRSRINRLVQSSFLSAVWGRPVRYVDIMKRRKSEESSSTESDEKDDYTVLNELTFPEFLEALYEFTVLKVRASIRSKMKDGDDTKHDDDHHLEDDEESKDGDDKSSSSSSHDIAPHQTLEKFIAVSKSIVGLIR